MINIVNKVSEITGLNPVKFKDLNDEQKNSTIYVITCDFENFSDEEFQRVLDNDEIKELIKSGFNSFVDQSLIYRKRTDFIEVSSEQEKNGKNISFVTADDGQPIEKYGFEIIKHFLHLRICKI